MKWIEIVKNELPFWNERLKSSNASFFQYPYYAAGYKYFIFSTAIFLKLLDDSGNVMGFCCILRVQFLTWKIGLIIRGPVFFNNIDIKSAIELLKKNMRKEHYVFLRINPGDAVISDVLEKDKSFTAKDFFPSYKGSQSYDLIVCNKPETELLHSFRDDCRNKIRFQKEMGYEYKKLSSPAELRRVYALFTKLGSDKKFSYRPYSSYRKIFEEGYKHDLCSVYTAELNGELICAAFIVKDGFSCTYFSGALMLKNIKPKFSPANNLHYLIMKDCFYSDNKLKYNLSYSPPGSGVHMFKLSFKPVEEKKPGYYTYVLNKPMANLILRMQQGSLKKVRNRMRRIINIFTR